MFTELLIIFLLILLNGVFAGAEIAILSLRKTRLAELVEAGSGSARAVSRLRESPESFLATVQIGITVVGATAAAFGGASLAERLGPVLAQVEPLRPYAEQLSFGVVVGGVSFLSLVLGELVPKSLALRAGETYALLIGRPLAGLAWAARPVVALLTGASNLVLRIFGDSTSFTEGRLSREEVQQIVDEAASAGAVDRHAGEIAARALDFDNLDAWTVMIPRGEICSLSVHCTHAEVARMAQERRHARMPVWEGTADNVIGYVNLRDVLASAAAGEAWDLRKFVHEVPFVPDGMTAPALLRRLQEERSHIALVINEQGTIMGLVTVEDLLEELVGDILSENDRPSADFVKEADGSYLAQGSVALHLLIRDTGIELPEGDWATLAGLALSLAGRVPKVGAVLTIPECEWVLEVVEATPRRVKQIRLRRARGLENLATSSER